VSKNLPFKLIIKPGMFVWRIGKRPDTVLTIEAEHISSIWRICEYSEPDTISRFWLYPSQQAAEFSLDNWLTLGNHADSPSGWIGDRDRQHNSGDQRSQTEQGTQKRKREEKMTGEYFADNLSRAIKEGDERGRWILDVAQAQIAYEQLLAQRRIANHLETISKQLGAAELEKKAAAIKQKFSEIDDLPILQALRDHHAPISMIEDMHSHIASRIRFGDHSLFQHMSVEQIEKALEKGPYLGDEVDEIMQRRLRVYLLHESEPLDVIATADASELPIYQYLTRLPLPTRYHNALMRSFDYDNLEIRALTVEAFRAELDKPHGGILHRLRNLGRTGIEEIRKAVAGEIQDNLEPNPANIA
jgi:hypothetical protein